MSGNAVWLKGRGVVRVFGPDAAGFLQGILTNDVETLGASEARYAALLTPQGKILFDFLVVRLPGEGGFLLDCNAAQAKELAKRLGFYKLRAKVQIVDESENEGVVALWSVGVPADDVDLEVDAPGAVRYVDPRAQKLGERAILPLARAQAIGEGALSDYDALRVSLGAPEGGLDFAYGDVFPHDVNLDLMNGVDFEKGCYVGQEVVSRMKHRGGIRKRIVRVKLGGEAPPPGTAIVDGDLPVGALGGASGREALALVRTDRAEDAREAGRALRAEGVEVTLL